MPNTGAITLKNIIAIQLQPKIAIIYAKFNTANIMPPGISLRRYLHRNIWGILIWMIWMIANQNL